MATSGTVATTTINTAQLIDHAVRRAGLQAASQTPELVQIAKGSLYSLLLSLANRGLNLWCVQKDLVGLAAGQASYDSPAGTIDILNVIYTQPTRVTGTDSTTATSVDTALASPTQVVRVGFKLSSVTAADTAVISYSANGVSYTTLLTVTKTDWTADKWYWYDLPVSEVGLNFKLSFTNAISVTEWYLATTVYDLPTTQWNRDTYAVINNKSQQGRPSTSYYLEKLLTPRVTMWPVPNNDYDHLTLFTHRQIQDIGGLSQQVEIPQRWVEGIIWQLCLRICFEVPGVDPARLQMVTQMSERYLLEAESDETDGAPIFLTPNIRVYTR